MDPLKTMIVLAGSTEHGAENGDYLVRLKLVVGVLPDEVLVFDGVLGVIVKQKVDVLNIGTVGLVFLVIVLFDSTDAPTF